MDRRKIADLILSRISEEPIKELQKKYLDSSKINYLVIDNLLPNDIASEINYKFPMIRDMKLRSGPQEKKFISTYWSKEKKIVEECLFSFQDRRVIAEISKICQIEDLSGDPELYAGGVSLMDKGCFLNPHIDNSHDRLRKRYRRLNLLYYVTKSWNSSEDGGELILFPKGINEEIISIPTEFNRLVIMRTDNKSLHGVNKINSEQNARKCISNYYFSVSSPSNKEYYHSTSFRGFKKEKAKDIYLRINAFTRTTLKSFTGNLIGKFINTGHYRKK